MQHRRVKQTTSIWTVLVLIILAAFNTVFLNSELSFVDGDRFGYEVPQWQNTVVLVFSFLMITFGSIYFAVRDVGNGTYRYIVVAIAFNISFWTYWLNPLIFGFGLWLCFQKEDIEVTIAKRDQFSQIVSKEKVQISEKLINHISKTTNQSILSIDEKQIKINEKMNFISSEIINANLNDESVIDLTNQVTFVSFIIDEHLKFANELNENLIKTIYDPIFGIANLNRVNANTFRTKNISMNFKSLSTKQYINKVFGTNVNDANDFYFIKSLVMSNETNIRTLNLLHFFVEAEKLIIKVNKLNSIKPLKIEINNAY